MQTLEKVILVDDCDREIGTGQKHAVHRQGSLHRAFSVIVWDTADRMLLQQRSSDKYHSGGLWTNACCGHPRPGESTPAAARRRLVEELGFSVPLTEIVAFPYSAKDAVSGLVEHEYLHVFRGVYTGEPCPNPDEVGACRWMLPQRIRRGLVARPDWFTPWFALLNVRSRAGDEFSGT